MEYRATEGVNVLVKAGKFSRRVRSNGTSKIIVRYAVRIYRDTSDMMQCRMRIYESFWLKGSVLNLDALLS